MGDRLATTDMNLKLGVCPFGGGGDGFPSNTMWLGLRPTSWPRGILIHPAIWPQQTWAENCGLCPFGAGGRGDRSPSNTMWPGPRPTSVLNGILIHPAVWPQQTWAADYRDVVKACAHKFRKLEAAVPLSVGKAVTHLSPCGRAVAYLHALFHLDPSNRLATIHQRYGEDRTDRTTVR